MTHGFPVAALADAYLARYYPGVGKNTHRGKAIWYAYQAGVEKGLMLQADAMQSEKEKNTSC